MLTGVSEVQYDANHIRNPGTDDSFRLANYVNKSGVVADRRGRPVTETEVNGFRGVVAQSDSSGMHTFSFETDLDREELIAGVAGPASEHLDGSYLIGIHEDTDHAHVHIGEAGTMAELEMSASDVRNFASDVATSLGVSYG